VPGIERHPLKKLSFDEEMLLKLLYRWRDEGVKAGHTITRIVVAFEAGRDGFWLARWLRTRSIELMSSTRRALPFRGSIAEPRRIGSTLNC
jgi:transposase